MNSTGPQSLPAIAPSRPICILGMHRSGTSMMAGLLRVCGIELGPEERMMTAKPDNPSGFWEHLDLFGINERLLARLGGSWQHPPLLPPGWERDEEISGFFEQALAVVERDFGSCARWAFKDPRSCLLLPFWKQVVPDARFLICVRNPLDAAASLEQRNGMATSEATRLWALYTATAIWFTRSDERHIVLTERLLDRHDQEADALASFLGVLSDESTRQRMLDHVDTTQWHHRSSIESALHSEEVHPSCRLLYAAVLRASLLAGARGNSRNGDEPDEAAPSELDLTAGLVLESFELEEAADQAGRLAAQRQIELDARAAALGERDARLLEQGTQLESQARQLADQQHELEERGRRIEEQTAQVAQLQQVVAAQTTEIAERQRRLEAQVRSLEERERLVLELSQELEARNREIGDREQLLATARDQLFESRTRVANLERWLEERQRDIERQAVQLARHETIRAELEGQLTAVTSSVGWQLLNRYRTFKESVVAPGGAAERVYTSLMGRFANRLRSEGSPEPEASPPAAPAAGEAFVSPPEVAAPVVPPPPAWREDPKRPPVVVIVPSWNRLRYLKQCLPSLLEQTRYPHFHVCVFDQGSTDETDDFIRSLDDRVTSIRSPKNVGFVHANNIALAAYPEWDVVFLNNDTRVTEGWLEHLVETAYAAPEIGMVGAKLLYPDGRLQEAGSQLFSDGSARAYGKYEAQGDPRFNQCREVDYCSAACLFVKREVLAACGGGFDPGYSPGYYEDADLALQARAAGYKVLYEPRAAVVHHEHGTSNKLSARRFMEHNRARFADKWRTQLAERPKSIWAAPRGHRDKLLVIGDIVPAPDRSAGGSRLLHFLRILSQEYDVAYAFLQDQMIEEYLLPLERLGIHVFYPGLAKAVDQAELDLKAILSATPWKHVVCSLHSVAAETLGLVRALAPQSTVLVDTYDVHFLRELREAELLGDDARRAHAFATRDAELATYRRADLVLTVTEADRSALLAEEPGLRVGIVPTLHPPAPRRRPRHGRRGLLFVGGFSHRPNVDAMLFFCREVLPLVREEEPETRLEIVGNSPTPEILALDGDAIRVTGYVPSIETYLDSCLVSVAPIRYGSGMKGKIAEAMAYGLPVVTTPIGAEGMDLVHGEDVLIAEQPVELAQCIVSLLRDAELWQRLADRGYERVARSWAPEALAPRVLGLLATVERRA